MQLNDRYHKVFGRIPVFGMIHLAGCEDIINRALYELEIYEGEGVDAVIVENYHGEESHVRYTLEEIQKRKHKIIIGVNILPNEFQRAISLAVKYGADFVQLDYVAGAYAWGKGVRTLNVAEYSAAREQHPEIIVLGGVWPKYYTPVPESDLERDILEGMTRAEAVVVTGAGTGKATPLDKIIKFREVLGTHPLVVGAGLTPENAYEQLCIADGAIVGSSLKVQDKTENWVNLHRVRKFMDVVRAAREYKASHTNGSLVKT